jgi:lipopolysaccharide transport system ATP-binding protein
MSAVETTAIAMAPLQTTVPRTAALPGIAVRTCGLTKRYRVGASRQHADRLSDLFSRKRGSGKGEEFRALDDVSLEVRRGEMVGIIGRNGAGKSTLFKILSRVVRPSSGTAELHGRLASLLEVGTGFHPELTGRDNIYMSGIILGMTRSEVTRRFDDIVMFAGVGRFLDTPIKWYSSGMQTRLGFAVAAHLDAEILLVDEVLSVGDAAFQAKCLGKMREIVGDGRTVLFTGHDLPAIEKLCNRAIWLEKGRVRADSPDVGQLIREYLAASVEPAPGV